MEITLKVLTSLNVAPQYKTPRFCNENFVQVNKCCDCSTVGMYEDMHPVNPCFNCGGKVKKYGAGKWVDGHWCVRII